MGDQAAQRTEERKLPAVLSRRSSKSLSLWLISRIGPPRHAPPSAPSPSPRPPHPPCTDSAPRDTTPTSTFRTGTLRDSSAHTAQALRCTPTPVCGRRIGWVSSRSPPRSPQQRLDSAPPRGSHKEPSQLSLAPGATTIRMHGVNWVQSHPPLICLRRKHASGLNRDSQEAKTRRCLEGPQGQGRTASRQLEVRHIPH